MFKKLTWGLMLAAAIGSQTAWADLILAEYAFNVDGNIYDRNLQLGDNPFSFAGLNQTGFDLGTGLGQLTLTISGAGAHSINFFSDIEMSQLDNSFFNETATKSGAPVSGLTWEVDEPGWTTPPAYTGDIYDHFKGGTFDNSIFNGDNNHIDDVSVGLGWNFSLAAGETATLTYNTNSIAPASGFYITHIDPDSKEYAFYSTNLKIDGGGPVNVPEPATGSMVLLGSLLVSAFAAKRRK